MILQGLYIGGMGLAVQRAMLLLRFFWLMSLAPLLWGPFGSILLANSGESEPTRGVRQCGRLLIEVVEEFRDPQSGALSLLGEQEGFGGFTQETDRFFEEMLEREIGLRRLNALEAAGLRARLQQVGLRSNDGSSARLGRLLPQQRILRSLKLVSEAADFKGEAHTAEGYKKFLKSIELEFLEASALEDFIDGNRGALTLLGEQEGFGGFTQETDRFFEEMLERVIGLRRLDPVGAEEWRARLKRVGLKSKDGTGARGGRLLPQQRILRALRLVSEAAGFKGEVHTAEAYKKLLKSMELEFLEASVLERFTSGGGALRLLGGQEGITGFSNETDRFFEEMLERVIGLRRLDPAEAEEWLGRLKRVGLKSKDGTGARGGRLLPQQRILRALRLVSEAAGFKGEVHTAEAYQEFQPFILNRGRRS